MNSQQTGPQKVSQDAHHLSHDSRSFLRSRIVRRFCQQRAAVAGLIGISVMILASAVGPYLLRFDAVSVDILGRFAPPLTNGHILGTDAIGRDIAARILIAGRVSLSIGLLAMAISIVIGTAVGLIGGFYGGRMGAFLMRIVDAFLSFPNIFLLLALASIIRPDPPLLVIIIAVTSWMEVARIVYSETRSIRERDFILAAQMVGLSERKIMTSEIVVNVTGPIMVAATLTVAHAIMLEAYVSFLGYGIQPPTPSWGNMLNGAQQYLGTAPWLAIFPGIAITCAVLSFNFIGDGLRAALDSRSDRS
ncbi:MULTISPECIES: ABC transporter permease [Rhizobium/Agrobacterium group]|uniref:ABC transporter permease n=1 Tax=Agrobacterium rosae TaxID=1972867 RepID=UPI002550CC0C|nr:ABC transporter permease [Agrobacterium rosae]MCM2436093.1 ABC transporter permease [Agrobacterium rosae]